MLHCKRYRQTEPEYTLQYICELASLLWGLIYPKYRVLNCPLMLTDLAF